MIDVFALFGIILMGVLPNQQKKTGSRFFALFKPRPMAILEHFLRVVEKSEHFVMEVVLRYELFDLRDV